MTKKEIIYRFLDISVKLTKVERDSAYKDPYDNYSTHRYTFNHKDHCCVDLSHIRQRVMFPLTMVLRVSKQFGLTLMGSKEYLREYFYDRYRFPHDYHYDFLPF